MSKKQLTTISKLLTTKEYQTLMIFGDVKAQKLSAGIHGYKRSSTLSWKMTLSVVRELP